MSGVLTSAVDLRTEYLKINNAIETVLFTAKARARKTRIVRNKRVNRQVSHY